MINANQITSRLRMMSDQELQRFAEMHKQDPYMFPLAFNESNMRKEMRAAPQGQGAAPQAPVNQQALAAMQPAQLPEDQGIGALNPNMQFADGGLVSFAGGGESTAGPYSRADDRDFGTGGVAYADGGAIRFAKGKEVPIAYEMYGPQMSEFYAPNPADMYGPDIDRMIRAGLIPPPANREALLDYIEGASPSAKKRGDRSMDSILAAPVPVPADRQTAPLTSGTYGAGLGTKYTDRNKAALDAIEERARLQQPAPVSTEPKAAPTRTLTYGMLRGEMPDTKAQYQALQAQEAATKQAEAEAAARTAAERAPLVAWQNARLKLAEERDKAIFAGRDPSAINAKIAEMDKNRPTPPPVPAMSGSPLEQQKALVNARVADAQARAPGGPLPSGFPIPGASGAGNVPLPSMPGGPGAARAPAAAVAPRAPGGLPPVGEDYRSAPAIEKMFGKYVTDAETEAQKRIEEYQKDRPAPETFAEQKALLEENRADVEKESRMNEGLAWLTFASRVVQPGKNTIQALVEGASAGGEQYARAQKDLKKAEKERKMGLAALAQAERAEKRNDYDKVEMYKQQAMQRADKARDASVLALSHATGEDTKIAAQRMDSALNRQSQEGIAAAGNATTLQAAQMRLDAEQREAQLRYAAGQAKLNADDFDQLMKFVQTPQGMVMTPPEAVAAYARMKATYGAVRSSPTVVDTPGTRAP